MLQVQKHREANPAEPAVDSGSKLSAAGFQPEGSTAPSAHSAASLDVEHESAATAAPTVAGVDSARPAVAEASPALPSESIDTAATPLVASAVTEMHTLLASQVQSAAPSWCALLTRELEMPPVSHSEGFAVTQLNDSPSSAQYYRYTQHDLIKEMEGLGIRGRFDSCMIRPTSAPRASWAQLLQLQQLLVWIPLQSQ